MSKYFPESCESFGGLVEILTLQLIYLIMQQKKILKIFNMLILRVLH